MKIKKGVSLEGLEEVLGDEKVVQGLGKVWAWKVIKYHLENNLPLKNNLESIGSFFKNYDVTLDNLDFPTYHHQVWVDNLKRASIPYDHLGDLSYLDNYVNVNKGGDGQIIGSGGQKYVYLVEGKPEEVLARIKHDHAIANITFYEDLVIEYRMLQAISGYDIPVSEIYGITKHRGIPTLVKKRYEKGIKAGEDFDGIPDYLVTTDGVESLFHIRTQMLDNNLPINDLQFLIDNQGRFFIDDPLPRFNLPDPPEVVFSQNPNVTGEFFLDIGNATATNTSVFQLESTLDKLMNEIFRRELLVGQSYTETQLLQTLNNKINGEYFNDIYMINDRNIFTEINGNFVLNP